MIKIHKWYPDDLRNRYWNEVRKIINMSEDDKVEFLPGCEINIKKLIQDTRYSIFKEVDGIEEYIILCRFIKASSSNFTRADFLDFLVQSFPNKIKTGKHGGCVEFEIITSGISVSVNNSCGCGSRILHNPKNIIYFYEFFLREVKLAAVISPSNTFKEFLSDVRNWASQNDKKYSFIDYPVVSKTGMRDEILISLNLKCCPYCNRQYITSWVDENDCNHSTADLDHFYQKKIYPLFSLSLFNFIPSCQICNSRMKGEYDKDILYPFEEGMEYYNFQCVPKNITAKSIIDLWLSDSTNKLKELIDNYEIVLKDNSNANANPENKRHIEESIELFRLKEVYKNHIDTAIDEILKIRIYLSGDYAVYANNTLKLIGIDNTESKNGYSEKEMQDIILGFITCGQDILDQPLGKMKKDIFDYEMKLKKEMLG